MSENAPKDQLFDRAYRERFPLFGSTPTGCVVMVADLLPEGAFVADLGCGDGRDSLYLLERGFNVHALDVSSEGIGALIAEANRRGYGNRLNASVADITTWNPTEVHFDAVVGITVLDHIAQTEHRGVFDAVARGLRSGGLVAWEMYSERDPSQSDSIGEEVSEFSIAIESVSPMNYLVKEYIDRWRILHYSDRIEFDGDHGAPHYHGFCSIVARKDM